MIPETRSHLRNLLILLLIPLGCIGTVWLEELAKYRTATEPVTANEVDSVAGTLSPAHGELDDFDYRVLDRGYVDAEQTARQLAAGQPTRIHDQQVNTGARYREAHLRVGPPAFQLQMGAGLVADVFYRSYRQTGSEERLQTAARYLADMADHESNQWLSKGYLWNDHAIAARILLTSRVWSAYRRSSAFDPQLAARLLSLIRRDVALSMKPGLYTYRTNHGLIQDLAVLHAATLFPDLIDVDSAVEVARERMGKFLEHYVSPDGIVLEHSAGYHEFGIQLLGYAQRYFHLLGRDPPPELGRRLSNARDVYFRMLRPDHTLPIWGDTQHAPIDPAQHGMPRFESGLLLSAEFGLLVDNVSTDDYRSQLFMQWVNFISRAHKHRDEMSMDVWADGVAWWRGMGYWPYGIRGREVAEGWSGHNAPHLIGEPHEPGVRPTLEGMVRVTGFTYVHLSRPTYGSAGTIHRQVVYRHGAGYAVIDWADTQGSDLESAWTTNPGVDVQPLSDGVFLLTAPGGRTLLSAWSEPVQTTLLGGDDKPGLGWVGSTPLVQPSHAVQSRVRNRAMAHVGTFAQEAPTDAVRPTLEWTGPRSWTLQWPPLSLSREGDHLDVTGSSASSGHQIRAPRIEDGPWEASQASYVSMQEQFGVSRDYLPWRIKVTRYLLVAMLLGIPGFYLMRALLKPTPAVELAALAMFSAGWIGVAAWLNLIYFVPS